MTNGWPCWKRRGLCIAASVTALGAVLWLGFRWSTLPRTPDELFRVRCSTCHELRTVRVCDFSLELRPAIVETMRRMHGADQVIDEREAKLIASYLGDPALCAGLKESKQESNGE
jgi:hypothetical protein